LRAGTDSYGHPHAPLPGPPRTTTGEPGTPSLRLIQAGVINGRIDARPIHGALRGASEITSPNESIVHGIEYDNEAVTSSHDTPHVRPQNV
jgi:hypothetical protein